MDEEWTSEEIRGPLWVAQTHVDRVAQPAAQREGAAGYAVLRCNNIPESWNNLLHTAATIAPSLALPFVLLVDGTHAVLTRHHDALLDPLDRVAFMAHTNDPILPVWQRPRSLGRWKPHTPARSPRATHTAPHRFIPGPETAHIDGAAWLQAENAERFTLLAGSALVPRFPNSMLGTPNEMVRQIGLRCKAQAWASAQGTLITLRDLDGLSRSQAASLAKGRVCNGQIAGHTYGTSGRNDRDIWPLL